jgi:hypothetical protein
VSRIDRTGGEQAKPVPGSVTGVWIGSTPPPPTSTAAAAITPMTGRHVLKGFLLMIPLMMGAT